MKIEVNKIVKSWISKKFIKQVLSTSMRVIRKNKKIKELSIALVGENTIKALNHKYRQVNKVTDVLAFPDPAQIIICWPEAVKQSQRQGHSQKKELTVLLIHGLLHILGYDHERKKEKKLMDQQAEKALAYLKRKKIINK